MKKISFNQDWTFQKGTGGIFAMISGARMSRTGAETDSSTRRITFTARILS